MSCISSSRPGTVKWTNYTDKVSFSDEDPGVVTCFSLNPAGTHRGPAVVDDLVEAKQAGASIDNVVWDPGFSLCSPGTTHHKLAQAGIHQTAEQRGLDIGSAQDARRTHETRAGHKITFNSAHSVPILDTATGPRT